MKNEQNRFERFQDFNISLSFSLFTGFQIRNISFQLKRTIYSLYEFLFTFNNRELKSK